MSLDFTFLTSNIIPCDILSTLFVSNGNRRSIQIGDSTYAVRTKGTNGDVSGVDDLRRWERNEANSQQTHGSSGLHYGGACRKSLSTFGRIVPYSYSQGWPIAGGYAIHAVLRFSREEFHNDSGVVVRWLFHSSLSRTFVGKEYVTEYISIALSNTYISQLVIAITIFSTQRWE